MDEERSMLAWAMFASVYLQGCRHPHETSAQIKDEELAAACADRMLRHMTKRNWSVLLTKAKEVGDW